MNDCRSPHGCVWRNSWSERRSTLNTISYNDAVHSQRVSADKLEEHIAEVKDLVEQATEKRRDQEGAVVSDIATILAYHIKDMLSQESLSLE